jgi:hypothetical protein
MFIFQNMFLGQARSLRKIAAYMHQPGLVLMFLGHRGARNISPWVSSIFDLQLPALVFDSFFDLQCQCQFMMCIWADKIGKCFFKKNLMFLGSLRNITDLMFLHSPRNISPLCSLAMMSLWAYVPRDTFLSSPGNITYVPHFFG